MSLTQDVQNLPGLDDRKMNELIALRAAQQVVGTITAWRDVEHLVHDLAKWLDESSDENLLARRYVLLVATQERRGLADRDFNKVRQVVDEIYRKL